MAGRYRWYPAIASAAAAPPPLLQLHSHVSHPPALDCHRHTKQPSIPLFSSSPINSTNPRCPASPEVELTASSGQHYQSPQLQARRSNRASLDSRSPTRTSTAATKNTPQRRGVRVWQSEELQQIHHASSKRVAAYFIISVHGREIETSRLQPKSS